MKHIIENEEYNIEYGRNASENWGLIDKAEGIDYWLHVDEHPSTHVIIEYKEGINKKVFEYGAKLCVNKTNSLKKKKIRSVRVMYTEVENIEKGKSVGEVCIKEMSKVKYIKVNME